MPYADGEEGEAREAESYPGRLRILLLALAAATLVVPAPATSVQFLDRHIEPHLDPNADRGPGIRRSDPGPGVRQPVPCSAI